MFDERNRLAQNVLDAAGPHRDNLADVPLRQAFAAAVDAFRARKFYYAPVGSSGLFQIIYYNAGSETEWMETRSEQRAGRLVAQLNLRLAAGWDPDA